MTEGQTPRALRCCGCELLSAGRKDQPAGMQWWGRMFKTLFISAHNSFHFYSDLVASSYLHFRRKESILIYSQTKLALFALKAF